jgi:outer membrane protein OmpA-like peptidoglycan-associated protein
MKNHFVISMLFSFFLIQLSYAQPLLFSDEFDKSGNNWSTGNNSTILFKVENGAYKLTNKDFKRWHSSRSVNYFSHISDFEIEAKIKLTSGNINSLSGIEWDRYDNENCRLFEISGDGHFCIRTKLTDDEFKEVVPRTKSSSVKGIGTYNVLKIKAVGQKISYYINDNLVYSAEKPIVKGSKFGFVVADETSMEVDYIHIRQESLINLADHSSKSSKSRPLDKINTTANENRPILSKDGKTLYFSRDGNLIDGKKNKYADCWYAKKGSDGIFKSPVDMGKPLNNSDDNFIVFVSENEQSLILANQYDTDGEALSDELSISKLANGRWSMPQNITIKNFYNEGTTQAEYCFSPDKKILISAINNENSTGAIDLCVSFQIDERTYSKPQDMGSVLNSIHSESFPVLSPDTKKLYFTSNGHAGYGNSDIFVSERLDDSWMKWSTPKNLGPELNSAGNEMGFYLNSAGEIAYFTSFRDSVNNLDIYEFYSEDKKADSLCLFSGIISDAVSQKPLAAEITFFTSSKHNEVQLLKSNPGDGSFKGSLPIDVTYDFYGIKKGYYSVTSRINLKSKKDSIVSYKISMLMYPVQAGLIVPMPNLAFNEKNIPTEYSIFEIERLLHLMEEYPTLTVQLKTPLNGTSQNFAQAESVMNYLISKGINESRFQKTDAGTISSFEFKIVSVSPVQQEQTVQTSFSNDLKVSDLKKGQKFRVENLYFMADSSSFTSASNKTLSEIAGFLTQNKNIKVEIGGHTNGLPTHEYCDRLSNDRAKSVYLYLLSKGVSEKMITFKGYGKREAIDDNSTASGRAKNQRVEIKIIEIY